MKIKNFKKLNKRVQGDILDAILNILEREDRLYRFKLTDDIEGEITPEQFSQLSEEQRNDWKNVSITLHDVSDKVIEFNEFE